MKIIAPFATTVAAAALLTAGAYAQTTPSQTQTPPSNTPTTMNSTANAQQQANQWRGSQLMGLDVYNNSNEKVGDITEVILGRDGRIEAVVIGVGGFLGMGQHDVGVRWEQLTFSDKPVDTKNNANRNTNTTMPNNNTTATPPANNNRTTTNANDRSRTDRPDHAMINLTREQLKQMPAYKYASDRS